MNSSSSISGFSLMQLPMSQHIEDRPKGYQIAFHI
jgi:hypothetical protein